MNNSEFQYSLSPTQGNYQFDKDKALRDLIEERRIKNDQTSKILQCEPFMKLIEEQVLKYLKRNGIAELTAENLGEAKNLLEYNPNKYFDDDVISFFANGICVKFVDRSGSEALNEVEHTFLVNKNDEGQDEFKYGTTIYYCKDYADDEYDWKGTTIEYCDDSGFHFKTIYSDEYRYAGADYIEKIIERKPSSVKGIYELTYKEKLITVKYDKDWNREETFVERNKCSIELPEGCNPLYIPDLEILVPQIKEKIKEQQTNTEGKLPDTEEKQPNTDEENRCYSRRLENDKKAWPIFKRIVERCGFKSR